MKNELRVLKPRLMKVVLVSCILMMGLVLWANAQPKYSVYQAVGTNDLVGLPIMLWTVDTTLVTYNTDRTVGTMQITMYHEADADGVWEVYSSGQLDFTRETVRFYFDQIYGDDDNQVLDSRVNEFAYKTRGKKITLTDSKGNSYEFVNPKS